MSNKIRSTSIRIISLISCFMLLVSALILPAAATDTGDDASAYSPDFINLLDYAVEYKMDGYRNGQLIGTQYGYDPIATIGTAGTTIKFSWGDYNNRVHLDGVYIGIEASVKPSSVVIWNANATYIGHLDDVYYYGVHDSLYTYISPKVDITLDSPGSIQIVNMVAYLNKGTKLNSVYFRTYGQFMSDGQYYYSDILSSRSVDMGYKYYKSYSQPIGSSVPFYFFAEVSVNIPVPVADSVSLTFSTSNLNMSSYLEAETFGVTLLNNEATQEVLDHAVFHCVASGSQDGQPIYIYTVNVDLSGMDLRNCSLRFRTRLRPEAVHADTYSEAIFYNFNILSCSIKNDLAEKPWYVRYYYWIKDEFSSLKDTIKEAFGVGQAAPDTSDEEDKNNQVIEDQEQSNDELQGIIDGLEEAPTVPDFDNTGLGEFGDDVNSNLVPVQSVFVVIFENPLIYQMITYVFMFGLGGFLLFGER